MQVCHRRANYLHRVILFGLGAEIPQVISREVDPADKPHGGVHHHNLAVQAAEPVCANPQRLGRRIEHLHRHACLGQLTEKPRAQLAAAKAIQADHDLDPTLRRLDQDTLQLMANLVFEEDKGLQQDLAPGLAQRLEYLGKVRFAVLQQLDLITALPAVIQVACLGFVRRLVGRDVLDRNVHSSISTDSGTWSERWDHGRVVSTCGL